HDVIMRSEANGQSLLHMAYQLLTQREPRTLTSLAEQFYMNKMAVREHLQVLSDWLSTYHLQLISKQRIGNYIEGRELYKRNALAHLSELEQKSDKTDDSLGILQFFPDYEVQIVRNAL